VHHPLELAPPSTEFGIPAVGPARLDVDHKGVQVLVNQIN
jgi:hypothetical protein